MLHFFLLLVTAQGACTQVRVDGYHWRPRMKRIQLGMKDIHLEVKPSTQSEGYSLESERHSLRSEAFNLEGDSLPSSGASVFSFPPLQLVA